MNHLDSISEAAYLTAQNAVQYRTIMRIFYEEYEKMRFQLYKEDVYERLLDIDGFADYTMDQLKLDLTALVNWKNLTPIQDPRNVTTIDDFKNKQFRYTMSEYAVEIERLTVQLENLFIESHSLSPHYFIRILNALEKTKTITDQPLSEINQWWRSLQEDFKILNQNYQDYLREFYSGQSEKLLKSMEFLIHKDHFISYLREFVRELQHYSGQIENCLKTIPTDVQEQMLARVIKSELDIPRLVSEEYSDFDIYLEKNIRGKWDALIDWFTSRGGRPSESYQVLEITNEVIRKMIQNAAMILQMHNWGMSRKDDYKKYIKLFLDCTDIEEAHRLSSLVFGAFQVEHFQINASRSTENINSSVYEEEPLEYALKPRTHRYRPRMDRTGFEVRTFEKIARQQEYLQQANKARELVMKYKHDGKIKLDGITDIIPEAARSTLLRWIAAATANSRKSGRTEYGQAYRVEREEGDFLLRCEDGTLRMPRYTLVFEDGGQEVM